MVVLAKPAEPDLWGLGGGEECPGATIKHPIIGPLLPLPGPWRGSLPDLSHLVAGAESLQNRTQLPLGPSGLGAKDEESDLS